MATVVRTGLSPMNPKVKWAELSCGHEVWVYRKPRIGDVVRCEKCEPELPTGKRKDAAGQ